MGAEQSLLEGRKQGLHPGWANPLLARAMLKALQEAANESGGSSEKYEHAWDPRDCSPPFIVLPDRLTARRRTSPLTTDCIRGKKGYRGGRHVWEIMWENEERGTFAIVGVATPKAPLQSKGYDPLIGSNSESWGWDIVNNTLWHCGKRGSYPAVGTGFQVPDTFFVILDMDQRTLSFSTSDVHLGVAFTDLPKELDRPMCPVVNAIFSNCDIRMRYMGRGESIISNLRQPEMSEAPPQAPKKASEAFSRESRKKCAYMEICRSFITTLNLNGKTLLQYMQVGQNPADGASVLFQLSRGQDVLFDHDFDKCYCTECHASRNKEEYYKQGKPKKRYYALPIGWARFGLKMERTAEVHEAHKDWHVAYHGTSPESVKPILEDGKLLMPGDETLEGKRLSEVDGHFTVDNKPEGFNTKQIFVSPSIRYSGLEAYAHSKTFEDPQTKKTYKAKVAFQLWIKPDSYKVDKETVGAEKEIENDPKKISNQKIEWSTKRRNAIHLYGVLVCLEE